MRKTRPHSWWRYALPLIMLAVLLSACAGGGAPSGRATPTLVPAVTPSPTQTPMPAAVGFLPTPIGTRTPAPILSLTPVALATPARDIFFDHPEERLRWDGPDERVESMGEGHCGPGPDLKLAFGIPALIDVDEDMGFWFYGVVTRESDWGWTGYSHDEWQIWQGDDARTIYLVHAREEAFAFRYRQYHCI